jgi:ssDNA-binding Zn-finger/Zn-ribbon topoisomerase 1
MGPAPERGAALFYSCISLALVILLVVLLHIAFPGLLGRHRPEYARREFLFTAAEFRFLQVLRRGLPSGLEIFAKVRVADVLLPVEGLNPKAWRAAFNQITGKHLDFVLCDRESGRIACAIELNDRSHERKDRRKRDEFIARACAEAGFPLIMVPAARDYDTESIRATILGAMEKQSTPPLLSEPPTTADTLCPRCGARLTRRVARRGQRAGSAFLACERYPACHYTTETRP